MKASYAKLTQHRNSLSYALLGAPLAMLGIPVYIFLPAYYQNEYAVSIALMGVVLFLARSIDVVTDPLIGRWSDQLSHIISRKLQIMLGLVGLLVFSGLLFLPYAPWVNGFYIFIISFFTYLSWTLVQVPYMALSAQAHSTQKMLFNGYREALAIVGVTFLLSLPFLTGLQSEQTAFYVMFMAWFVGLSILGGATLMLTRLDYAPQKASSKPFWASLKILHYNHPEAFAILPWYFVNNLANALPATLFLIFVGDFLQLKDQAGQFLLIYFVMGIIALPVWFWLAKKIGALQAWRSSIMLAVISFSLVFWLQPGDSQLYFVICILTGASLGVDMAIPASIQANLAHKVSQSGINSQGTLFGLWGLVTKLALALAALLTLPLVDLSQAYQLAPNQVMLGLYAGLPIALKLWVFYKTKNIKLAV